MWAVVNERPVASASGLFFVSGKDEMHRSMQTLSCHIDVNRCLYVDPYNLLALTFSVGLCSSLCLGVITIAIIKTMATWKNH